MSTPVAMKRVGSRPDFSRNSERNAPCKQLRLDRSRLGEIVPPCHCLPLPLCSPRRSRRLLERADLEQIRLVAGEQVLPSKRTSS